MLENRKKAEICNMFLHQFTIGKINVSNGISLNIGVVVRNTSTSHIEVMIWSVTGSILSPKKKWSSVYDLISVHLANPDHHNPFSVFSVFVVLRGACPRKKSALGASTMRGPCVSLLSAAHRGRPPLTPWYTGTQQLGPLGGAER